VFVNLIRYALNSMERDGNLIITSFESDQNVNIDFKHSVIGRKPEDPEQLFLPFDEGGPDIGLPLCYKLVRNMGGLLSLEQQGDYMTFTVSFPKAPHVVAL
jgi:signal transduction histidine kinase